jgi:hypothetical protein
MAKSSLGLASLTKKPKRFVTGGEIKAIYQDLFGRAPDDEGLAYWADALKGKTKAEAYAQIGGAASGQDASQVDAKEIADKAVKAAYEEQLGRKADDKGLKYYTDKVLSGQADINRISAELDRSTEGYNYDAESLVNAYRKNFGRNPDQEGFQYWMGQEDQASSGIGALSDAFRSAASGKDIAAAAAQPTGYTSMDLEALRADPYAGLYATENPYLFDLTPEQRAQMVNVSQTQANQYIQFTNPVTGRPVISRVNPDGSFTTISGDDVLQAANVRGAMNLALNSGALTQKAYDTIESNLLKATPGTKMPWEDIYSTLSAPQARVILNNMGIQIGEDADPVKALAESSARNELVNQTILQQGLAEGTIPSTRVIGQQALATNQAYPFTEAQMQASVPRNRFTTADVLNNLGTQLGNAPPVTRQSLTPEFFGITPGMTKAQQDQILALQPTAPGPARFQTYADRALLGEQAPGYAPAVFGIQGLQAPAPFLGVPAAPARPAVNVSPEYQGAQDVAGAIGAAQGKGKAEGGIASLAEKVQDQGRGDDTMLVHMTPNEVAGLQALAMQMGGSGTINPVTGLPEFGWLDKAWKNFLKPVRKVARGLGPIGTMIAAAYGGPWAAALVSGLQNKEKTFDFKRAATTAAATYIGGKIVGGMTGAEAAPIGGEAVPGISGGTPDFFGGAPVSTPTPIDAGFDIAGSAVGDVAGSAASSAIPPTSTPVSPPTPGAAPISTSVPMNPVTLPSTPGDSLSAAYDLVKTGANLVGIDTLPKAVFAGTQAYAAYQGNEERKKFEEDQARQQAEEEERLRLLREQAYATMRANPINFGAEGGIMVTDEPGEDLARGGLKEGSFIVPADVVAHLGNGSTDAGLATLAKRYGAKPIKGAGDGMSDSIPTHIEGKQRARVADGEAIIEPMVTQKVGAKNLYAMLDKVRKARTGTTKQGKEINPMRYMPA